MGRVTEMLDFINRDKAPSGYEIKFIYSRINPTWFQTQLMGKIRGMNTREKTKKNKNER